MPSTPKQVSGLLYSGGKLVRAGNRAPLDLRPLEIIPNFISSAEGSVLISLGETRVICTASIEDGVPVFLKGSGKGWITGEYAMIPRATESRSPREVTKGRPGGRTMEIQRLIGRCLRAVINLQALGERTVWLDCDVIRADGGTRTTSVTGAWVAMALGFRKLQALGMVKQNPIKDYVAATSAGIVGGELLLDLDYAEDSHADIDLNVAMTGAGALVEVQATAERNPYSLADLTRLIEAARPGIEKLLAAERSLVPLDSPAAP
jgi:ribonuclease PH